eukprot:gnl/TRDRNA2_/TRDRNA2_36347_c0_seq1.p1 gnl/TRDRNA2_/TRDRNA2_36347_c0~~gnl/TRDRNA2_/TRDRNA2_36347_c0_seq1.p1  ORF type:complete len:622 (+),score=117.37 gnl/TRDRNA2_/TRDRNA2_36347_c0_seq1:81-1946(+)
MAYVVLLSLFLPLATLGVREQMDVKVKSITHEHGEALPGVGDILDGKYTLVKALDAEKFLARDPSDTEVVVKLLNDADEQSQLRAADECLFMQKLQQASDSDPVGASHILKCLDNQISLSKPSGSDQYIVLEYGGVPFDRVEMDGDEQLKKLYFAADDSDWGLVAGKQLLQGIKYLASQGIVHRGIKVSNILVKSWETATGQHVPVVKLSDFQLSTTDYNCGVLGAKEIPVNCDQDLSENPFTPPEYRTMSGRVQMVRKGEIPKMPDNLLLAKRYPDYRIDAYDVWSVGYAVARVLLEADETTRGIFHGGVPSSWTSGSACQRVESALPIKKGECSGLMDAFLLKALQVKPDRRAGVDDLLALLDKVDVFWVPDGGQFAVPPPVPRTVAIAADYDGCFDLLFELEAIVLAAEDKLNKIKNSTEPYLMKRRQEVIGRLLHFLDQITAGANVHLFVGSNRQAINVDSNNRERRIGQIRRLGWELNEKPEYEKIMKEHANDGFVRRDLTKFASERGWKMERVLLADEPGDPGSAWIDRDLKFSWRRGEDSEVKNRIVNLHMKQLGEIKGPVSYYFFDDRAEYLDYVREHAKVPENVELYTVHFNWEPFVYDSEKKDWEPHLQKK